nr:ABC transporter permease [Anaerolineae bacterium]
MSNLRNTLRRTRAIIIKELTHIRLDPGFLFLTILAPAVLLTLLSYVFSFDVNQASLAVFDQDLSPQSHEYIRALTADGDITIVTRVDSYADITDLFKAGHADAAMVIPPGFGSRLSAGDQASVNLVVDGSDAGVAFQIINAIEQRTIAHSTGVTGFARPPFDVRIRIWFNENLRSQYSMVPGLMALVLILPAMAIALSVAREKETGTFESLVTTPIVGREYLLGKLIVYLALGLVGGLLALVVAVYWFRVPFRGDLALFILLTADYLFAIMGFCLFIANFIRSQRAVSAIILLALFIPSFFLTGLILPVDKSSIISAALAYAMPSTHYIVITRGIALKGVGLADLQTEALALFGMGLFAVFASLKVFSKKLN